MTEYIDLETGEKCRDYDHAAYLYTQGHRIRHLHDGKPVTEWIPGSNDYYVFADGKELCRFEY